MAGIKELFIGIMLLMLFAVSIIGFGNQLQVDNGVNNTILGEKVISNVYLNTNLTIYNGSTTSTNNKNAFDNQSLPDLASTSLSFSTVISGVKNFGSITMGGGNIILEFFAILGIPAVVVVVFASILVALIMLLAWRMYKVGE